MKSAKVKLGDTCEFIRGVTFDKADATTTPEVGKLPILRAGNIGEELDAQNDLVWVPESRVADEQRLRRNDIAICMSSGSSEVVGKTARVPVNLRASVGSFCGIIRPRMTEQAGFLSFYFRSPAFAKQRDAIARGANIQNLRFSSFEEIEIEIPNEQQRIAKQLEQADRLRRTRRYALELSDSFLPAAFLELFGDPTKNPKCFEQTTIGEAIRLKSGESMTAASMGAGGIFPVYGGNGISGYHTSYLFENRQIVIGRVGVYCGAVHYTEPKCWISDNALYAVEKDARFDDIYLIHALMRAKLNQYADSSGQPLISQGRLEKVSLLVPPAPLQQKFAALVERHEHLRATQREALRQAEHLFQTLLHQAFSAGV